MNNTSRDALLMAVNQAGFAVTEANLYLDTRPCDSQAIAYLKQMSQAYADARNAYEAQYGPLRAENARDRRRLLMWIYEKRLEFPVNIKEPNAKMAMFIMSQYGGP